MRGERRTIGSLPPVAAQFLLLLVLVGLAPPLVAASRTAHEPELRAAVILAILRYTVWPAAQQDAPAILVCIVGDPPSAPSLLAISDHRSFAGRRLRVSAIPARESATLTCHVAILGHESSVADARQLAGRGVLTICDSCNGAEKQSTIHLLRRRNRIAFDVDLGRATRNGFSFSSAMLELAANVRR